MCFGDIGDAFSLQHFSTLPSSKEDQKVQSPNPFLQRIVQLTCISFKV